MNTILLFFEIHTYEPCTKFCEIVSYIELYTVTKIMYPIRTLNNLPHGDTNHTPTTFKNSIKMISLPCFGCLNLPLYEHLMFLVSTQNKDG